eukprot:TRINITY_DN6613_c0_g1_i1.p1 TRINITY_DN6613_c0_g1~~TRINITY_DN6613_c0_g1_i1.p1  ORF type:complete len:199 (+),score=42.80 TRINITY_DN6613_c0_g1_i1:696-1292(+)
MSLTWVEFCEQALHFEKVSAYLNDSWCWIASSGGSNNTSSELRKGFGYLAKKMVITNDTISTEPQKSTTESVIEESDPASASQLPNHNSVLFEVHILYSISYQVPVVYFNVFHPNGKPFQLDEIQKVVKEGVIITQCEHPILNVPFWSVHPCETKVFMAEIFTSGLEKSNYLVSWLSLVLTSISFPISSVLLSAAMRK